MLLFGRSVWLLHYKVTQMHDHIKHELTFKAGLERRVKNGQEMAHLECADMLRGASHGNGRFESRNC